MPKLLWTLLLFHGNSYNHEAQIAVIPNFATEQACIDAGQQFRGNNREIGTWCFETVNPYASAELSRQH